MPAVEEPSKLMNVAFKGIDCSKTGAHYPKAWRVRIFLDGEWHASRQGFGRKQDAMAALAALIAAGLDTPEKIKNSNANERNRIMCGALAW